MKHRGDGEYLQKLRESLCRAFEHVVDDERISFGVYNGFA
jgi:hypothetical protein